MHERIIKVALPEIRCQLHDHAKQYDNEEVCHNKWNGGKLHGNISQNGYGNAIIGSMVAVLRKVMVGVMVPAKVARHKRG